MYPRRPARTEKAAATAPLLRSIRRDINACSGRAGGPERRFRPERRCGGSYGIRLLRPIMFARAPCAATTQEIRILGAPTARSAATAVRSLAPALGTHRRLLRGVHAERATCQRR